MASNSSSVLEFEQDRIRYPLIRKHVTYQLDKSDHLCPEAVTGLCSYRLHYSPTRESVDRRTNDVVVASL
ncbi:hypothetical protein TNCV_2559611 [Trichonephila clavipes]|nr:hypothetical protein TNCV_2559611 [Trichonephila clavipes]